MFSFPSLYSPLRVTTSIPSFPLTERCGCLSFGWLATLYQFWQFMWICMSVSGCEWRSKSKRPFVFHYCFFGIIYILIIFVEVERSGCPIPNNFSRVRDSSLSPIPCNKMKFLYCFRKLKRLNHFLSIFSETKLEGWSNAEAEGEDTGSWSQSRSQTTFLIHLPTLLCIRNCYITLRSSMK